MLRNVAVLAALLAATGASAAPVEKSADRGPDWLRRPNANQLKAVWPTAAAKKGVGGSAAIRCTVTTAGTLSGCQVVDEKPAGLGFGGAVLLLAPSFLMRPAMKGGKPVESTVTIPMNFRGTPPTPSAEGERFMAVAQIWDQAPGTQDMAKAWPAQAGDAAYGHVVLRCGVAADGALKSCIKISEEPGGRGFLNAARALVPAFRLRTDGVEPKVKKKIEVNLPIHFVHPNTPQTDRQLPKPDWTRRPAPDKVMQLFPAKAADSGLRTGRATVECGVERSGELSQCRVVEETPTDMGFGPAAVALADALAVNPWTFEGRPAEGAKVRFPIRINSREAEQPAAKP